MSKTTSVEGVKVSFSILKLSLTLVFIALLSKIHTESVDSVAKFQTTFEKWTEIKALKDPMLMNDELQLQKNRVEELLKQKDIIIAECRKELQAADDRYARDIRKQIVDIQSLVHRADTEVEAMKSILKENLDLTISQFSGIGIAGRTVA